MTGILLLAHGSREPETGRIMEAITGQVQALLPGDRVETAYLQFGAQSLEDGLEKFLQAGVREIRVIPYFLFEGVHVRRLQSVLAAYQEAHPEVSVRLGHVLGDDARLAEILADRAREMEPEAKTPKEEPSCLHREDCPCKRVKCSRHGDCAACREHHRENSKYSVACDRLREKAKRKNMT